MPARRWCEDCSTLPMLFNIYNQAVMRQASEERSLNGSLEKEVVWNWIPGGSFAGENVWEKESTQTKKVNCECAVCR